MINVKWSDFFIFPSKKEVSACLLVLSSSISIFWLSFCLRLVIKPSHFLIFLQEYREQFSISINFTRIWFLRTVCIYYSNFQLLDSNLNNQNLDLIISQQSYQFIRQCLPSLDGHLTCCMIFSVEKDHFWTSHTSYIIVDRFLFIKNIKVDECEEFNKL